MTKKWYVPIISKFMIFQHIFEFFRRWSETQHIKTSEFTEKNQVYTSILFRHLLWRPSSITMNYQGILLIPSRDIQHRANDEKMIWSDYFKIHDISAYFWMFSNVIWNITYRNIGIHWEKSILHIDSFSALALTTLQCNFDVTGNCIYPV